MGLETGSFIADLVASNPIGASDPKSQGDDHLRLIKAVLLGSFPNVNGAVTATPAQLNFTVTIAGFDTGNFIRKSAGGIEQRTPAQVRADIGADNAGNLASGTVPDARFPATLPAVSGANLTSLNASNVASGTLADARLSSNVPLKNANNDFTGAINRFTAAAPNLEMYSSAGGSNEKLWQLINISGVLSARTRTDENAGGQTGFDITRSGTSVSAFRAYAASVVQFQSQNHSSAPATTGAQVRHADGNLYDVGMNVMPLLSVNANTVISRAHAGKILEHTSGSSHQLSTPASTDTDIPVNAVINGRKPEGAGAWTIVAGSGVTLRWFNGSGALSTGTRTIAIGGVFSIFKASASVWDIWGTGIS